MRVAISGSSGLIGGIVAERLGAAKEIVRLGRRAGCEIQVDFSRPETVARIDLGGCEALIHCAGIVDEDFKRDPAAAYLQNTVSIDLLAQRAAAAGIKSLIYLSSTHVYGPFTGRITEETPVNPLSDYAIAHYAAEQILKRNSVNRGPHVLVLRPNAVFGVPCEIDNFDRWTLIPFSFPLEAVYQQKIVLLTSGEQRRNFVGAGDVAALIEAYLDSPNESQAFQVVNSVGRETTSVYEFAGKCATIYQQLTGKPCIVERPQPSQRDQGADFELTSSSPYQPKDKIDDFLVSFMTRIIGDLQHGKTYGAATGAR